jgi:hypothetical protein
MIFLPYSLLERPPLLAAHAARDVHENVGGTASLADDFSDGDLVSNVDDLPPAKSSKQTWGTQFLARAAGFDLNSTLSCWFL